MAGPDIQNLTARPPAGHPATALTIFVVAIAALYIGAGIFVPLVLAILLTFALSPIVRALHRWGLPQLAAVILTVVVAAVLIALLSFLVASELAHLAADIPKYQQIIAAKLQSLQEATNSNVVENIANGAKEAFAAVSGGAAPPLPVTIVSPATGPLAFAQTFLLSLLGPLATAAIVVVFVVCLLLEREDFRDRFLKLVSRGDLRTSTRVMTEAGRRVSRYLLIQLAVNVGYGAAFGAGLSAIGIPDALLWGLLTALFRYIPFVGTLIAACLPLVLAVAIDPQWNMLIEVGVIYLALELVITNAVEPRLYGSSTGLSSLAIIVSAMFWATLWGPIGLILATPLTVCLVVIGRYVPQLQFLEVLLGSEPVLVREEQFYQRLVSGNTEEAIDLAEQYIAAEGSPLDFYANVALPALLFAENDRGRDDSDMAGRRTIADGMDAVTAEVGLLWATTTSLSGLTIVCIGGRTELDDAAADILAQVFAVQGADTRVLPPVSLRPQGIGQINLSGVDVVCLTYLEAEPLPFLRYAAKRLRRNSSSVRVIASLFAAPATREALTTGETGASALALSIAQAVEMVRPPQSEPNPVVAPLHYMVPDRRTNQLAAEVAGEFLVQIAIIAGVGEDPSADSSDHNGQTLLRDRIVAAEGVVVVQKTSNDKTAADNAFIVENGFGFFAGAKIMRDAEVIGVLMIFDHDHDDFGDADRLRLQHRADAIGERSDISANLIPNINGAPNARTP